jgi:hypothetical protein
MGGFADGFSVYVFVSFREKMFTNWLAHNMVHQRHFIARGENFFFYSYFYANANKIPVLGPIATVLSYVFIVSIVP